MEQDVCIRKALLAQKASRHFEMADEVIEAIRQYKIDVKQMPKSLLIESYASVMSELKLTLRELIQQQGSDIQNSNQVQPNIYNIIEVSDTIQAYSHAFIDLIRNHLLSIEHLDKESRIVYLNLMGDCFRNVAELVTDKQDESLIDNAVRCYHTAYDMTRESMDVSNPIKVQLALSYSSFANDLLYDPRSAYQIAAVAFTKAQAELNENTPELLQENTLLQKLYDSGIQSMEILSFQNTNFTLKLNPKLLKFKQIKRSEFVEKAMLSRYMKRYYTMAATMKNLIKATSTVNLQEGKLFSEAFQKLVDERKLSLGKVAQNQTFPDLTDNQKRLTKIYLFNISKELKTLCNTVLHLISKYILNNDLIDQDSKLFFMNMKCKYLKYLSEVVKSTELGLNQRYADNVKKTYLLAQAMQPTSDIRLEATLNFAVYVADDRNEPGTAYQICNTELIELGNHEKEVEDLEIVPKMYYYKNTWNMKQHKNDLCELTTNQYTGNYSDLTSIAEFSGCYLDMAIAVKNLIDVNRRLDFDERHTFNFVLKKLVDERRDSLDNFRDTETVVTVAESEKVEKDKLRLNITAQENRNKIKDELEFLCWYTIHLLNTLLSIDNIEDDAKLYYLRMKGDFYRYLTEIGDTTRNDTIRNALNAYKDGYKIAMTKPPVDAYRLDLILNYAAFLYDPMDDKRNADSMLRQALCDIGNEEIKDSGVSDVVEKMKRILSTSSTAAIEKDSMPPKGGLQHKDLPKKNDLQQKKDVLKSNAQQKQNDNNSQKKDNKPQKGHFQAKTIVPLTNYFPDKKSMSQEVCVSQTDNMSEKSSVSQTDNLSKRNTVPQAGTSQENANGSVNKNFPKKDQTKLKEKPPIKPPNDTKKQKKTEKKEKSA